MVQYLQVNLQVLLKDQFSSWVWACNTAGGSHHASFNEGAGFCVFNDVAVGARYLQKKDMQEGY